MATNEGGLNYNIRAIDQFSSTLTRFEKKIASLEAKASKTTQSATRNQKVSKANELGYGPTGDMTKSQWDLYKKTAQKEIQAQAKAQAKITKDRLKQAQSNAAKTIKLNEAQAKSAVKAAKAVEASRISTAVSGITSADSKDRKEQARLLKESIQGRAAVAQEAEKAAKYNDLNYQADQRLIASARELGIKRAQITKLVNEQGLTQRAAAEQVGITSAQAKQLGLKMWDAEHAARQLLFTFRRLVGILAVFTAARKFAQYISAAVVNMVKFNAELEASELSIATIITSLADVRDASGNLLTGQEKFNASMIESSTLVKQLRQDAVGSIATFEELTRGFEEAAGPGLAAGLDLQQIREISQGLVEGAKTFKIPINQLGEEIRSLLKGTATQKNTRLALLFGGAAEANQAIRQATEQGNLYEVLQEKLEGIGLAVDNAGSSFSVLASNLKDVFRIMLTDGGTALFDEVKTSIKGIQESITGSGIDGELFNPTAIGGVQELADGLASVLEALREFSSTGTGLQVIDNVLTAIAGTIRLLAPVAVTFFDTLGIVINAVLGPISLLLKAVSEINDYLSKTGLGKVFLNIVKYATATYFILGLWQKIFLKIALLVGTKGLLMHFKTIAVYMGAMVTRLTTIQGGLTVVNVLQAIFNAQLDKAAITTSIISGGITLLVGLVTYLIAKFAFFDKQASKAKKEVEDLQLEMEKMSGNTFEAANQMAEGAKSAAEWADEVKDITKQIRLQKAIGGLGGVAKDIASATANTLDDIEKQTKAYRDQIVVQKQLKKESEDRVADIEKEIKGIEALQNVQQSALAGSPVDVMDNIISSVSGTESRQNAVAESVQVDGVSRVLQEQKIEDLKKEQLKNDLLAASASERITETQRQLLGYLQLQTELSKAGLSADQQKLEAAVQMDQAQLTLAENASSVISSSVRELNVAQLKVRVMQTQQELADSIREQGESNLVSLIASAEALASESQDQEVINSALSQKKELENQLLLLQVKNGEARKEETAELESQIELAKRKETLLAGDVTSVIKIGLEDYDPTSLGESIAATITDAMESLSGVMGGIFKDAIDPRTDADLKTAFGEFFLDLAGSFAEALIEQMIVSPLVEGMISGLSVQAEGGTGDVESTGAEGILAQGISYLTQGITALGSSLLSLIGVETTKGVTQTTDTAAQTTSITAAIGAQTASLASSNAAAAATVSTAIATKVNFGAKGGLVQSFASGGGVSLKNSGPFPRPSNVPASDTVPAWLTPGEFVMKRSVVKNLGVKTLAAINNGMSPGSFSDTAFSLGGAVRGIQSFASGGSVSPSATNNRGGGSVTTVLPVIPANETTMKQLMTGGRNSFNQGVNSVDYIGDPNKSGKWG